MSQPTAPKIPHDVFAEEAVIGSILINPDCLSEVTDILDPKDFYIHRNRWALEAMLLCVTESNPIDILTVEDALRRLGYLNEFGGAARLTELAGVPPSSLNAVSYARIVKQHSIRRAMIDRANRMAQIAYNLKLSTNELESGVDEVMAVVPSSSKVTGRPASDVAEDLKAEVMANAPACVPSYIPAIDKRIGGYEFGKLTIQVGYSRIGKSTFYTQIAEVANFQNFRVLTIQRESPEGDVVLRRVLSAEKISIAKWRNRDLTVDERKRIIASLDAYKQNHKNIIIDDQAYTLKDLEKSIRHHRPDLVIVDDASNMAEEKDDKTTSLVYLTKTLKYFAKKYKCAIVLLHHPDNNEASRLRQMDSNSKPNFQALAWAKDLPNLTDVLLWMVEDVNTPDAADEVVVYEWVLKDRMGAADWCIPLLFNKPNQWFDEYQAQTYKPAATSNPSPKRKPVKSTASPMQPKMKMQNVPNYFDGTAGEAEVPEPEAPDLLDYDG